MRSMIVGLTCALVGLGCGDTTEADAVGPVTADSASSDDISAPPEGTNPAGRTDLTLSVDGLDRQAIVYVPEQAVGAAQAPVVIMLHGSSGSGEKFFNISGWVEQADAVGLIAVFPSALNHCFFEDNNDNGVFGDPGERKVTTKWAAGKLGDPARMPLCDAEVIANLAPDKRAKADHAIADDMAFFDALLDRLETEFSIDSKRIYVTGFSNGAAMSTRLIAERSQRFAAGAGNAGLLDIEPVAVSRPLTFVFALGATDDRFVPAGSALVIDEAMLGAYPALNDGIVAPLLTVLQLADPPTYAEVAPGGKAVGTFTWETSTAGADNRLIAAFIEGLGHQYPNGKNHAVTMAKVLWDIFEPETLP